MTFDNGRTIIGLRIRGFVATVIFLLYIILTYVGRVIRFPIADIRESTATIILTGVYLIIIFLPLLLKKMYIYYSDDGDDIVLRYFYAGMITGKKNSIVINKKTFAGYRKEKGFLGIFPSIIITQRVKQGVAKYPPVCISSLKRKEKARIFNSLNEYSDGSGGFS
jgi:hypothetical protein